MKAGPGPVETKDYVALRRRHGDYSRKFKPGETYNIWSEETGRDYIIFSVDGKNVRTKDLAGKVDLTYYAEHEDARVFPLRWSQDGELVVRTRLVPTDEVKISTYGILFPKRSYDARKQSMSVERALEVFSSGSTWSEEIFRNIVKKYVDDSLALQQVLKRERKEKTILFSRIVLEVAPLYAVECLETASGRDTLCAVVRGPIRL